MKETIILKSKDGVTQGYPLVMVGCRLLVLSLN